MVCMILHAFAWLSMLLLDFGNEFCLCFFGFNRFCMTYVYILGECLAVEFRIYPKKEVESYPRERCERCHLLHARKVTCAKLDLTWLYGKNICAWKSPYFHIVW